MIDTYVIVRTKDAGVFAGTLKEQEGETAIMTDARRIWYWAGAASLSQLAQEGTSKPKQCKFPVAVAMVKLFGVIEILSVTAAAKESIEGVPCWTA